MDGRVIYSTFSQSNGHGFEPWFGQLLCRWLKKNSLLCFKTRIHNSSPKEERETGRETDREREGRETEKEGEETGKERERDY